MDRTINCVSQDLCPQVTLCTASAKANKGEVVPDERLDSGPQPSEVDGDTLHHGADEMPATVV